MTDALFKSWIREGFFKLSDYHTITKESRILVDKRNAIMLTAAGVAAHSLAGDPRYSVSHLYVAYNNDGSYPVADPVYTIDPSDSSFRYDAVSGVLRIPLTFPGTVTAANDNTWFMTTFNILINQPYTYQINDSVPLQTGVSQFFEAALVCQTSPTGSLSDVTGDRLVARVAFERLTFDELFNLTVSWGIKLSL